MAIVEAGVLADHQLHHPLALDLRRASGRGLPAIAVHQPSRPFGSIDRPQSPKLPDAHAQCRCPFRVRDLLLLGCSYQPCPRHFLLAHREVSHGEDIITLQLGRTESCCSHTAAAFVAGVTALA